MAYFYMNDSIIPNIDEILKKDRSGELLTSSDLLFLLSRSFSFPISHLETLKGQEENNKRYIVQDLYNALRATDEAEDGRFPITDKIDALRKLHYCYAEVARRDSKDSIDDLITGDLRIATEKMMSGAISEHKRVFIKHFARGTVLKSTQGFSQPIRDIIRNSVGNMSVGMIKALEARELQKVTDLVEYCDYVAGLVGIGLTQIVEATDNQHEILDKNKAKVLGRGLQLTNVAKNIREDQDARADYPDSRTLFIPRELFPGMNPQELFYSKDKVAKDMRENVFESLYGLARENLKDSAGYVASIPDYLSGYKAFCFSPLVTAIETWKLMYHSGAQRIFEGDESAVKISRDTFKNILEFTVTAVQSGKINEFLTEYIENPKKYSFQSGDKRANYEQWNSKWNSANAA